jgi:hypothetical protein
MTSTLKDLSDDDKNKLIKLKEYANKHIISQIELQKIKNKELKPISSRLEHNCYLFNEYIVAYSVEIISNPTKNIDDNYKNLFIKNDYPSYPLKIKHLLIHINQESEYCDKKYPKEETIEKITKLLDIDLKKSTTRVISELSNPSIDIMYLSE